MAIGEDADLPKNWRKRPFRDAMSVTAMEVHRHSAAEQKICASPTPSDRCNGLIGLQWPEQVEEK